MLRTLLRVVLLALLVITMNTLPAGAGRGCPEVESQLKILSPRPQDPFFAHSLAHVGDLDGDGTPELAVGFLGDAQLAAWEGSVVVLAGADFSVLCSVTSDVVLGGAQLGRNVVGLGDVDGDGTPDFAASAHLSDRNAYDGGEIVVFSGDVGLGCPVIRHLTDAAAEAYQKMGDDNGLAAWVDVSGDGTPEVLAGAQYADVDTIRDAGKVLVFDGANGSVLYTLTDPSPMADDRLGASVAGLGDVTGDGTPDIAAGAPRRDGAAYDQGAVLIFSGADGSFVARYADAGGNAHAWFGWSVTGMEDLDADGTPDLVAGAIYGDPTGTDSGELVALSGADGSEIWRTHDPGGHGGDYLGTALVVIADVDGDGVQDVMAGAPQADPSAISNAGRAAVFSGASGAWLRSLVASDARVDDSLGYGVAGGVDHSGDGSPDFAVTVSHDDLPKYGVDRGSFVFFAYEDDCDEDGLGSWAGDCDDARDDVYAGAPELCDLADNDCDGSIDEDEDGDHASACAEVSCGDEALANGDPTVYPGALELCDAKDNDCDGSIDEGPDGDADGVMWPCDCDDGNDAIHPGATDICNHVADGCGAVDGDATHEAVTEEVLDRYPGANDLFGISLATIGDVNGDAVPDFVVGARGDDMANWDAGQVTLYSGRERRVICRTRFKEAHASLGDMAIPAGDLDGDGVPDFAASARGHDRIWLLSGADCSTIAPCDDPYAAGNALGEEHGLARWVDRTGDGIPEILAGAPGSNIDQHHGGLALVFSYDRPSNTCSVLFELKDPDLRPGDALGFSLASVGDITGDGTADILVGERNDASIVESNGAVLVFSGADGSFHDRFFDPAGLRRDYLGTSVAGAPDLNGDGWPEVLAGAELANSAVAADGGIVVVFSGRDGSVLRRLHDSLGQPGDRLGFSFALVSDHDGDGLPDVLAGARYADEGGVVDSGRVVLLSSGVAGSHLASFADPTPKTAGYFGTFVASAGDLSGDGLDEFLEGSPYEDSGLGADVGSAAILGWESDCDHDGAGPWGGDCDDQDADLWNLPSEVRDVLFHEDKHTLSWDAPSDPGQASGTLLYDVLRSVAADDFESAGSCSFTDTTELAADLPEEPDPGTMHFYLVRAENGCGEGDLGEFDPEDWPRLARECP